MGKIKGKNPNKTKRLGKLSLSATGLRRMANAIQKKYKTKGDVVLECYIETYDKLKTLGCILD